MPIDDMKVVDRRPFDGIEVINEKSEANSTVYPFFDWFRCVLIGVFLDAAGTSSKKEIIANVKEREERT